MPFTELLPRVAAVVHHGGIGTTAEAFRAGVPQLIVPVTYDQFDSGPRAKRLGVADVMLAKNLSVRRMQRLLSHLLFSQKVGKACSAVAEAMQRGPKMPWLLDQVKAALGLDPAKNLSVTA